MHTGNICVLRDKPLDARFQAETKMRVCVVFKHLTVRYHNCTVSHTTRALGRWYTEWNTPGHFTARGLSLSGPIEVNCK